MWLGKLFRILKQHFCRHLFDFIGRTDDISKYKCRKCGKVVYDRRY